MPLRSVAYRMGTPTVEAPKCSKSMFVLSETEVRTLYAASAHYKIMVRLPTVLASVDVLTYIDSLDVSKTLEIRTKI